MGFAPNSDRIQKIISFFLAFALFSLGFLFAFSLGTLSEMGLEIPFSLTTNTVDSAPQDWISQENIEIYPDKVIIHVNDSSMSRYAPTGSMRPLLDSNANGIRISPSSEDSINVGDLITFRSGENHIIHRVIEKGLDEKGTYFITQGDNNLIDDGKVRFEEIEYITVAIIY